MPYPRSRMFKMYEAQKASQAKPFPRSKLFRSEIRMPSSAVDDLFRLARIEETNPLVQNEQPTVRNERVLWGEMEEEMDFSEPCLLWWNNSIMELFLRYNLVYDKWTLYERKTEKTPSHLRFYTARPTINRSSLITTNSRVGYMRIICQYRILILPMIHMSIWRGTSSSYEVPSLRYLLFYQTIHRNKFHFQRHGNRILF